LPGLAAACRSLASVEPLTALHAASALEPLGFGFAGLGLDLDRLDVGRIARAHEQRDAPDADRPGHKAKRHQQPGLRVSFTSHARTDCVGAVRDE